MLKSFVNKWFFLWFLEIIVSISVFNFFGSISVLLSFSTFTFSLLFYFLTCTFTKYKPFLVFFCWQVEWCSDQTKKRHLQRKSNECQDKSTTKTRGPLILLVHLFLLYMYLLLELRNIHFIKNIFKNCQNVKGDQLKCTYRNTCHQKSLKSCKEQDIDEVTIEFVLPLVTLP